MDGFIEKLKKREKQSIREVMAFMSYNPSIGRVLEKESVKVFQDMAVRKSDELRKIRTREDFDGFHEEWVHEFVRKIKTNKNQRCSYGQAQKAINVFLKLLVDWASRPDRNTAIKLRPFLHVPLDKILMKKIKEQYPYFYKEKIGPLQKHNSAFSLSRVDKRTYGRWQDFFRKKCPRKPLLFDIAWAIHRRETHGK